MSIGKFHFSTCRKGHGSWVIFVLMRTASVIALFAPSLLLMGQDRWPQFRGPNSSGIAVSDAAIPVEFGPTRRVLWKQALPGGHSSPVIWGDRIFLTAFDKDSSKLE